MSITLTAKSGNNRWLAGGRYACALTNRPLHALESLYSLFRYTIENLNHAWRHFQSAFNNSSLHRIDLTDYSISNWKNMLNFDIMNFIRQSIFPWKRWTRKIKNIKKEFCTRWDIKNNTIVYGVLQMEYAKMPNNVKWNIQEKNVRLISSISNHTFSIIIVNVPGS